MRLPGGDPRGPSMGRPKNSIFKYTIITQSGPTNRTPKLRGRKSDALGYLLGYGCMDVWTYRQLQVGVCSIILSSATPLLHF